MGTLRHAKKLSVRPQTAKRPAHPYADEILTELIRRLAAQLEGCRRYFDVVTLVVDAAMLESVCTAGLPEGTGLMTWSAGVEPHLATQIASAQVTDHDPVTVLTAVPLKRLYWYGRRAGLTSRECRGHNLRERLAVAGNTGAERIRAAELRRYMEPKTAAFRQGIAGREGVFTAADLKFFRETLK